MLIQIQSNLLVRDKKTQLDPWTIIVGVPLAVTAIFILWVIYRFCAGGASPAEYDRPAPPPVDGSDGISAAHGEDISYTPITAGGWDKGGFPVSGMGRSGKGSFGSRPHDEDE